MSKKRGVMYRVRRAVGVLVVVWMSILSPAAALADQAVDATGDPTGAPADTGAPVCTGVGCGQGASQGTGQGENQGGPTLEDLGAVLDGEGNMVLPEGMEDTRQGAAQGSSNGIEGVNANTGADSDNSVEIGADSTDSTEIDNEVEDTTQVGALANTGNNAQSKNTGVGGTTTGNASIGVTQLKNDNTAIIGGSSGVNVMGHNGDYNGDLDLGFGAEAGSGSALSGLDSIRAVNDTTGSDSTNNVDIDTSIEEITEIQNDGLIDNILNLQAITGQNEANKNTGDGMVSTGDANIAATLVNLLNTTVINGNLWLSVADIFGDLNGNINLPDLASLAAAVGVDNWVVDAANESTGEGSNNAIKVSIADEELTQISNEAEITTVVEAEAITGQNKADKNTGGSAIDTGDGSISASNISLANITVEGGNWGLVVVSALNRWLGFLVGEGGEVQALTQNETIHEIEARNSNTGSDSDNEIDIDVSKEETTTINNDAVVNNQVTASAITGQNEANKNTGQGRIDTGEANVSVAAINIANTTVKDGSLFVAVVNVLGDWFGDMLYGGSGLLAQAPLEGGVEVEAENSRAGTESDNNINVDVANSQTTWVDNRAGITTTLNADIDTGNNKANRNTKGADIDTGDGLLALNARAIANVTGILTDPAWGGTIRGLNDTTGFDSTNKIRARINDERVIDINNGANVSTVFGGAANTGDNEASFNTIGGSITTGGIGADVGIDNLVNRVVVALAALDPAMAGQGGLSGLAQGENMTLIDTEFINRLTGALSENVNEADVDYDFIADIINDSLIDNIIDLLLNTGGNKQNSNTLAGGTHSGAVCVAGSVRGSANSVGGGGLSGWSLAVVNKAEAAGDYNWGVNTGDNEQNNNTGALFGVGRGKPCPGTETILETVEPGDEPTEEEAREEREDVGAGVGGEEGGQEQIVVEPRVAAAIDNKAPLAELAGPTQLKSALKRFPVAGELGQAKWLEGTDKKAWWQLFVIISIVLTGAAWHYDRLSNKRLNIAKLD